MLLIEDLERPLGGPGVTQPSDLRQRSIGAGATTRPEVRSCTKAVAVHGRGLAPSSEARHTARACGRTSLDAAHSPSAVAARPPARRQRLVPATLRARSAMPRLGRVAPRCLHEEVRRCVLADGHGQAANAGSRADPDRAHPAEGRRRRAFSFLIASYEAPLHGRPEPSSCRCRYPLGVNGCDQSRDPQVDGRAGRAAATFASRTLDETHVPSSGDSREHHGMARFFLAWWPLPIDCAGRTMQDESYFSCSTRESSRFPGVTRMRIAKDSGARTLGLVIATGLALMSCSTSS